MSLYQVIIATCAILTVMAIYRVSFSRSFAMSAALGGATVILCWIVLIIIGSIK